MNITDAKNIVLSKYPNAISWGITGH